VIKKEISERKKFKNQNKKFRQNDGGLDTNKQTNTQKNENSKQVG